MCALVPSAETDTDVAMCIIIVRNGYIGTEWYILLQVIEHASFTSCYHGQILRNVIKSRIYRIALIYRGS